MRKYRQKNEPQVVTAQETVTTAEELVETVVPGISKDEVERIRQEALSKARTTRHEWRLKGRGVLACISCSFPHRSYIPTNLTLTGIDADGKPILQSIK